MKPFLLLLTFIFYKNVPELPAHVFHVSRCEIRHNTAKQSLEVTMHIFIDDLEAALKKQGHDKLFLCSERENASANKYLVAYIQQNFQLEINGQAVAYNFIGKETSDDMLAAWCYFEIPKVKTVKSVLVKDKMLFELFSDQKHIIQITVPGKKDGYSILNASHTAETFLF